MAPFSQGSPQSARPAPGSTVRADASPSPHPSGPRQRGPARAGRHPRRLADRPDGARRSPPTSSDTFPGEVLFNLAVDALDLSGASWAAPIDYEGLRQRHLPEISFAGKTAQQRSRYVLHAVAARRGGVRPDPLDEVG